MSEEERDSVLMRVGAEEKKVVTQLSKETGLTQRAVLHAVLGSLDFASDYGYVELFVSSFVPSVREKVRKYIENRGRPGEDQRRFDREEKVRRLVAYRDGLRAKALEVDGIIEEELKQG